VSSAQTTIYDLGFQAHREDDLVQATPAALAARTGRRSIDLVLHGWRQGGAVNTGENE